MAALMRSVWGSSRRIAVPVCSSVQLKRHVRALRRIPVRVIPSVSQQEVHRQQQARAPPPPDTGRPKRADQQGAHKPPQPKAAPPRRSPAEPDTGRSKKADQQEAHGPPQPRAPPPRRDPPEPVTGRNKKADQQEESELMYTRLMDGDPKLGKVVTIAKSKKFRDRHGQILLEGRRLLTDALQAGAILETLYFSRVDHLRDLPEEKLRKANLVKVKFEDIKLWSDVIAPHGLMGIFRRPDHARMKYPESQLNNTLPLSLICDNIRDPGNLGTILRCAAGAGCNKVLLTKGCVDAWEPKVIRAGMGAHFRLPIISVEWETISNYLSEDTKVFVSDNFWQHLSDETKCSSGKAIDYGWHSNDPRRGSGVEEEDYYSSGDEDDEGPEGIPNIPVQPYHERWARGPTAVVIGGETHGLSLESMLLAENTHGRRLYIPVVAGVESLNAAMAASIVLFEGRRQLQLRSS